jgi:hypothetical protein
VNHKSERAALRGLIANLPPPDLPVDHEAEALRLVVRLGLKHPMTLAAAMKLVAAEMPHGRVAEIERTARSLYAMLQRREGHGRG